jgi:hypothetical protein
MALRRAIGAECRLLTADRDEKAVLGALIRHSTMLSTAVNPTDGLRFDGGVKSFAEGDAHP